MDSSDSRLVAVLERRVQRVLGKAVTGRERIWRGYTPTARFRVELADGSSAFAKLGTSTMTANWLRIEHQLYASLRGDFMPGLLGFEDDPEQPLLLLEDMSRAHWPPPWRPADVERVLEAVQRMGAAPSLPSWLPRLEIDRRRYAGWLEVEKNPEPFLSLGLCSREWLENALPVLLMAQDLALLDGDQLVHGDLRSDNLCLFDHRVVFVDWNMARRGNPAFDLAALAPSLRLEGGPLPEQLLLGEGALCTLVCGYFAANAGLPAIPEAPRVRNIQLRQLRIALPWAARELGLPAPDLEWADGARRELDAALAARRIDEAEWYAGVEEVSGDAYLAGADPARAAGSGGPEEDQRWMGDLVLGALPKGLSACQLLLAGPPDGHALEHVPAWGAARGVAVTAYSLELSPRLASAARWRSPHAADKVWSGNVLEWHAPRRFDLVLTGLHDVPAARQRELLERCLRELLTPNGRAVLRPERVRPGARDVAETVAALGFAVGGVIERPHPKSGELWRSVWLSAPR